MSIFRQRNQVSSFAAPCRRRVRFTRVDQTVGPASDSRAPTQDLSRWHRDKSPARWRRPACQRDASSGECL